MLIHFKNQAHRDFFEKYDKKYGNDISRRCFFYAVGMEADLREGIEEIYNFKTNRINPNAVYYGWLTSNTLKLLRFAIDLLCGEPESAAHMLWTNSGTFEEAYHEACQYDIATLFTNDEDAPYMIDAIKLRYYIEE